MLCMSENIEMPGMVLMALSTIYRTSRPTVLLFSLIEIHILRAFYDL